MEQRMAANGSERRYYNEDDYIFPKTFEEFGYRFNELGEFINIKTGKPFQFEAHPSDHVYNQKRYEAIGELITEFVYNLLPRFDMQKMTVPIDASNSEPSTFIFHSKDAFINEKLIVLIHGSGVVRAGQWARGLIINESINSGTQIPFIRRATGLGYGVIVLNTNDNSRENGGVIRKIRGSECAENHANYVWENIILAKTAAKYIAIIAHSYGGIVTVNMCNTFPESFQNRVFAIAFTDSTHSLAGQGTPPLLIQWFQKVARNWITSHFPLDTPLPIGNAQEIECVSAGTSKHVLTSWQSFASIYEFIDSKYRKALAAAYDAADNSKTIPAAT